MKNFCASIFVVVFLSACGAHVYSNTHRGSLLSPPGYPPEVRAPESAKRLWGS